MKGYLARNLIFAVWTVTIVLMSIGVSMGVQWSVEKYEREACLERGYPHVEIGFMGPTYCVRTVDGSDEVLKIE